MEPWKVSTFSLFSLRATLDCKEKYPLCQQMEHLQIIMNVEIVINWDTKLKAAAASHSGWLRLMPDGCCSLVDGCVPLAGSCVSLTDVCVSHARLHSPTRRSSYSPSTTFYAYRHVGMNGSCLACDTQFANKACANRAANRTTGSSFQ
uniref:Uncharacterized protein n=1 Tax=Romanomermis culicivorax TaxID=13658 RepID=A0A915I8X0_ROMCU